MVAAALAAAAMVATRSTESAWTDRALWIVAAAGIQLRLLANLLDGLVAVEGNQRTPTGELWNEVPDRVSDTLILVAAGVTCTVDVAAGAALGVAAALVAMFVSYVRAVGRSLTGASDYSGPMAKPQRMATLTVAALATAIVPPSLETQLAIGQAWLARPIIALAILVITLGGVWTGVRRLRRLARSLTSISSRPPAQI
jgi:phosphatidylglycerophosphate synthase